MRRLCLAVLDPSSFPGSELGSTPPIEEVLRMAREMRFVDEAWLTVKSGRGGDGCLSFRREKYIPRGGPDGGNGGRGGHVIIVADPQVTTLLDIGRARSYRARSGQPGKAKKSYGGARPCDIIQITGDDHWRIVMPH